MTVVLTFKREQLLYDIKNNAYIEGHVMETDNFEQRHTVQDVGEAGNADRVTRVLDLAVAKCREALYPFTKHDVHREFYEDTLHEPDLYGIVLIIPTTVSQTTLNLLEKLIHEYLVCTAMADWLSITHPQKAETWGSKAQKAEREIRTSLQARMRRLRRKLHPF